MSAAARPAPCRSGAARAARRALRKPKPDTAGARDSGRAFTCYCCSDLFGLRPRGGSRDLSTRCSRGTRWLLRCGCGICCACHALRSLPSRVIGPAPAAFGTQSLISLAVENHGAVGIYARLVDDVPATLRKTPPDVELRASAGLSGHAEYPMLPGERGDAHFGRVYLRYQSVFRIAERWATAELSQTVRVYPNFEESRRAMLYLIRSRQVQLEKRLKRHRGFGREFESLREFREGDEYRDICWTATARRAHLVTKVHQVERSQTVWIVLDTGRLLRARVDGPSKLDYAVNAALSLAQVALYSGDNVGLIAYGRRIQQHVSAGRGSAHLRALIERLAMVHTEPFEANHLRAAFASARRADPA